MVQKCDEEIHKALGRVATDRELAAIYRKAKDLHSKIGAGHDAPTVLQDFADEVARRKAAARRTAAVNYLAEKNLSDWRKSVEGDVKDQTEIVRAMLGGSLLDFHGAKDSVLRNISSAVQAKQGAYWTALESANVLKVAKDPNSQMNIGKAKWDLQHGTAEAEVAKNYGRDAATVAKTMIAHENDAINELNRYGASVRKNPKNIVSRMIDGNKVARAGGAKWGEGFDAWKADISHMDWKESFDGKFLNAEQADRDKVLQSLYSQFLSGKHLRFDKASGGFGAGLGAKRSYSREIVFPQAEDEVNYLQKYGRGNNLPEQLDYWMQGAARDAQIMRKFGATPIQNFDRFIDKWSKDLNERGDVAGYDRLVKAHAYAKSVYWPAILDETAHPNANVAAKFIAASRGTFITAAKIGMSIISAFAGDPVVRALQLRYYSDRTLGNAMSGYAKSTAALFKGLSREDAMRLAADAGIRFQDVHRPMGLTPEDEFGLGAAARVAQYAMKYMGHSWYENRFHTNWLAADGASDAFHAGKKFADLPSGLRSGLQQFGITEAGWEVMRQQEKSDIGGSSIFQPQNIRDMELSKFAPLIEGEANDYKLGKARDLLADKYRNFMGERATSATSDPDLGLRAQVLHGTQRGTVGGEMWRSALMLKTWALKYMRNSIGRELYGYGVEKDPLPKAIWRTLTASGTRGGREGMAALITMGIFAGYMRGAMYDIANGKSPENVFDPKNAGHAFTRAFAFQSLGLLTDFVMDEARRNTDRPMDAADRIISFMGPTVETGADLWDEASTTARQIREGKFTTKAKDKDLLNAFNTVWHNVPGNNAVWAKWGLDHLVVDNISEALNPGYKKRLMDTAKKHGQHYLLGAP